MGSSYRTRNNTKVDRKRREQKTWPDGWRTENNNVWDEKSICFQNHVIITQRRFSQWKKFIGQFTTDGLNNWSISLIHLEGKRHLKVRCKIEFLRQKRSTQERRPIRKKKIKDTITLPLKFRTKRMFTNCPFLPTTQSIDNDTLFDGVYISEFYS